MSESNKNTQNIIEENISDIVNQKVDFMDLKLEKIEGETINLSIILNEKLKNINYEAFNMEENYSKNSSGMIIDKNLIDGKSSTIIFSQIENSKKLEKDLILFKDLDNIMKNILVKNEEIKCVYIITENGSLKVFPEMSPDSFNHNHNLKDDIYYKEVFERKELIWTEPYFDFAGRGWVVTCGYPLIIDGEFYGAVFSDITMNFFEDIIQDFRISESGYGFLMNQNGNIIFHPQNMKQGREKGEIYRTRLEEYEDSNLVETINILRNKPNIIERINIYQEELIIAYKDLIRLPWGLGFSINENDYIINYTDYYGSLYNIVLFILLITIILIFIATRVFTSPIIELSKEAEDILKDYTNKKNIEKEGTLDTITNSLNVLNNSNKQYMIELEERKNLLETIIRNIDGKIFLFDKKTDNNKNFIFKSIINNTNIEFNDEIIQTTLKNRKSTVETLVESGKVYDYRLYPIISKNKEVKGIILHKIDITEKTIFENELKQKEKLASIGKISTGITHELKTPLSVIKGEIYLLKNMFEEVNEEERLLKQIKESITNIEENTKNSEKIIKNLLDFSKKSKEKSNINLPELIDQLLLVLNDRVINKNIEVNKKSINNYNNLIVNINKESLKIVLLNILTNALEAVKDRGKINIEIEKKEDKIILIVEDNGVGIKDENLEDIFEPFFTTKKEGTGLGLWLAKNEIEKLNGEIKITINEYGWTRVSVLISL